LIAIREEQAADIVAIRALNTRTFGQPREAAIVDTIRSNDNALLSLVATADYDVVGHILYSPASIGDVRGAALGPMAVLPAFQRQGIGSTLVEHGNQQMKDAGQPFIIVLGHAAFYPRFGFLPGSRRGITCEWNVPDSAFMVLVLDEPRMRGVRGLAKYSDEFWSIE